jgi:hypothetical protein
MAVNKLNIYRKMLNLENLSDIEYIFDNKSDIDFVYDQYRFNPDISRDYLYTNNKDPEISKQLELNYIKEYLNDCYDLYYSFFEPTIRQISTTQSLNIGDTIEVIGLLDPLNDGFYVLSDVNTNALTITGTLPTDYIGTFKVKYNSFEWLADRTTNDNIINLQDIDATNYISVKETDLELKQRIIDTTVYRKMFLTFLPEFQKLKGTKTFITWVLWFYYLIKYYDSTEVDMVATAKIASTVDDENVQTDTNFVYQIYSLIPKSDWELYIKPVVHPHGWIDFYFERSVVPERVIQNDMISMVNKPTFADILNSNFPTVLNTLANINRCGNINMENFALPYKVNNGSLNVGGYFKTYETMGFDENDDKVINITDGDGLYSDETTTYPILNPPIITFDGYDSVTNATELTLVWKDADFGGDIVTYVYYTFDIDYLLIDFDKDPYEKDGESGTNVKYWGGGTTDVTNTTYSKIYIQSVAYDDTTSVVYGKSDIIEFDIAYYENNTLNPNPIDLTPIPPSPK